MAKIRKEFTNQCIKPLREDKPHIVFIDGYWRVSPMVKGRWRAWSDAHREVWRMNSAIHLAAFPGEDAPAFYDKEGLTDDT